MPISKRVRAAVTRVFTKPDADTVLHALARYRDPESDRVLLAVLVLSNGDPEAVEGL